MFHNSLRNHPIRFVIISLALLGMATLATLRSYSRGENAALSSDRAASASRASYSNPAKADEATRARVSDAYGKLPLSFEVNRGQTTDRVKFLSRGSGYSLFLTSQEAVIALRKPNAAKSRNQNSLIANSKAAVLRMKMIGANRSPRVEGQDELPGKSNYFIGNDPAKWQTNVPSYQKVRYHGIYPGVDLEYYGNQQQLEYDFVIAPHASARAIRMVFDGARRLRIDPNGDLVIQTAGAEIRQLKPVVYQEVGGVRHLVDGKYVLLRKHLRIGNRVVGFSIGRYDRSLPLVVDPTLVYSTFLGGTGNEDGNAIAVDALGNAYVAGATNSFDFPITAVAFQTSQQSDPSLGNPSGFVTKIDPTGSAKIYSTYLGGSCTDIIFGIAVNTSGEAYSDRKLGFRNQSAEWPTGLWATPESVQRVSASECFRLLWRQQRRFRNEAECGRQWPRLLQLPRWQRLGFWARDCGGRGRRCLRHRRDHLNEFPEFQ
jgi:hypothetical protein